jgi:LmbE family N-acetylglucosaminyl deacetylase
MKKRVLVVSPHPDDETYGVGGTILKLREEGHEVFLLVCCAGDLHFAHSGQHVHRSVREHEFAAVCDALHCKGMMLPFTEDSMLDTVPLVNLVKEIEKVQRDVKASVWYVASPSAHQDHRRVFEACASAARPTEKLAPDEMYGYETPNYPMNPPEWRFVPQVYEDITRHLDRKLEILAMYSSQVRQTGPMSVEHTRQFNVGAGAEAGYGAAERFQVVRLRRP